VVSFPFTHKWYFSIVLPKKRNILSNIYNSTRRVSLPDVKNAVEILAKSGVAGWDVGAGHPGEVVGTLPQFVGKFVGLVATDFRLRNFNLDLSSEGH
jgi:hypothetical protein